MVYNYEDEWTPHNLEDELIGGAYEKLPKKSDDLVVPVKVSKGGILPTKGSDGAAAYDLYASKSVQIPPGKTVIVNTGIFVAIPEGYDIKVLPRSGLSCKGVVVRNSPGLIDEDYRGELGVILKYEPENLCACVERLYKALNNFAKNLVSAAQFNVDTAKDRLIRDLNVNLFNPYEIKAGSRIAQIQLFKVVPFIFKEVDELDNTDRGTGGFGSTGE